MRRYTFGDGLPVRGSEAALITAAVAIDYPTTLTELARAAGITKFAASRAADGLVSSGLLTVTSSGYAFNDAHAQAPVIIDLVWRYSGIRRRPPTDAFEVYQAPTPLASEIPHPFEIPALLTPSMTHLDAAMVSEPGPSLQHARDTANWLGTAISRLREHEQIGQEVYSWWKNERLRDMIHLTLHLGGALAAARGTLISASGAHAQEDAAPDQAHISGAAWVRATYLVSAELRHLLGLIKVLDRAILIGGLINHRRSAAISALHNLNQHPRGTGDVDQAYIQRQTEEALSAEAEAHSMWTDESYGPYKHIGGTPREEDVGTAGDKIYAARLHVDATELASQVDRMAAHPTVLEWTTNYPDAAADHPLIRSVPTDVLRDAITLSRTSLK